MKNKIPAPVLILFCLLSCKKERITVNIRPSYHVDQWKFKVTAINYYCTDYYGRAVVSLECIAFPEGMELYYQQRYQGRQFYSTTLPPDFQYIDKIFKSQVYDYVDWQEKVFCRPAGRQITLGNVDFPD